MRDVHGRPRRGGSPASENRAASCNGDLQRAAWEHTSSPGVSGLRTTGKILASNRRIVCLFLWGPLNPTRGISNSSPAIVLRILADHPAAPEKHSKAGKRGEPRCWPTGYIYSRGVNLLLWTGLCQQQDVWHSQQARRWQRDTRTFLLRLIFLINA